MLLLLALAAACAQGDHYALSLLGEPLPTPDHDAEQRARLEADVVAARTAFENDPSSEDAIIWYGRRLAYLGRFTDAVHVFSDGLDDRPGSFRLLRHRGHRYITLRKLERAIYDLERAADLAEGVPLEVEPDGIPNARNQPIGNTHGNIWYHLGLARYLKGDLAGALAAYDRRAETDRNDDNRCATAYWRHIILMRLGRRDEADAAVAGITAEMDVIENHSYRDLCLLFRGLLEPDDLSGEADSVHAAAVANATVAYGVSMFHWTRGRRDRARALWREIVDRSGANTAFGYIAAEAELARR